MSRWIWLVLALIISTAVYFTIRYGLKPKAIPVLNPTQFEELEQVGVVIYKRLRSNIRTERLILLGSSPQVEEDRKIWDGLIKAMGADKERYVVFEGEAVHDENISEKVKAALKAKQLVIVLGQTSEVSHLVRGSLSRRLDKVARHPVLAISTLRLAVDAQEVDDLQTSCLDASNEDLDSKRLDCAAQKVARKFLKKRLAADKLWAVMERHGLKEYLLFIHRPSGQ